MNTFQLRCFLAVADLLSFAKAARSMNISQPAMTHQIKALEEELNTKLFHRSTRVVELTLEGRAFLADARSMVAIAQRAKLRFQNPEERPISFLSVGSGSYHHLACLADSLNELSAAVHDLHPRMLVAHHDQLFHMLENGSLDVVFGLGEGAPPERDVHFQPLCESPIVCVCRPGAPLAEEASVSVERLRTESIILCDPLGLSPQTSELQMELAQGRSPASLHFSGSVDASIVMARAGFGAAILPGVLLPPGDDLARLPILDAPVVTLGMFYQAHPGDELVRQFAKIAAQCFRRQTAPAGDGPAKAPCG
jgi:DNA-binding transcriptional LysR family regulator